jgi:hypothetical protein
MSAFPAGLPWPGAHIRVAFRVCATSSHSPKYRS